MSPPSRPLVSVLLPCFNAERYLSGALQSILRQSYSHLELIALDDGSTDRTGIILQEFARKDERVRVLENEANIGLIRTLNRGLQEARGDLTARMDADDVSLPSRFEAQVDFLLRNGEIDVVGTGVEHIDGWGRVIRRIPTRATSPIGLRFLSFLGTPLAHPTIMAKTEVVRRFRYRWDPGCLHVEDYDLFTRLAAAEIRMANLKSLLCQKRQNEAGVSLAFESQQVDHFIDLSAAFLDAQLGFKLEPSVHRVLVNRVNAGVTPRDFEEGLLMIERVRDTFLAKWGNDLDETGVREVASVAAQQKVDVVIQALRKGSLSVRTAAMRRVPRLLPELSSGAVREYLLTKMRFAD